MSALVFLTRCAVGIEFNRRRVAFVALVADLGLGCAVIGSCPFEADAILKKWYDNLLEPVNDCVSIDTPPCNT